MKSRTVSLTITFAVGCLAGAALALIYNIGDAPQKTSPLTEYDRHKPTVAGPSDNSPPSESAAAAEKIDNIETFDERVAVAFAYESERRKAWEIERLFENMTADEAPAILEMILANPEYHKPFGLLGPFFGKWGELDGASAYAASTKLEGREKRDAEKYLFPAWARSDVHAAWNATQVQIKAFNLRPGDGIFDIIREMAKQDPDTIIHMVGSDPNNRLNSSFRSSVVGAAAEAEQFPQLLGKVNRLADEEDRIAWTRAIYTRWSAKDANAPLDAISKIADPEEATIAMEGFLTGWAANDRNGALDYLMKNQGDPAVEGAFIPILQMSFFRGTPQQSMALAERLAEAGVLDKIVPTISHTLAFNQPEAAIRIAEKLSDGQERERLQKQAMQRWAQNNFDAAHSYYDQIESAETKAKLLPSLTAQLYRRSDGGTLLVSLLESVPHGPDRGAVLENLLGRASRLGAGASKDFLVGLELITESAPDLSAAAQASREKLFGKEP